MTLNENLKMLRQNKGLSQEKLAEILGVSRQAVTKWESGQTTPSSGNLIVLADLYKVSLDELLGKEVASIVDDSQSEKDVSILRSNLTRIAIISQTVFLNAVIQEYAFKGTFIWAVLTIIPLLLSSVWMAYNLHFEKDPEQRKKILISS